MLRMSYHRLYEILTHYSSNRRNYCRLAPTRYCCCQFQVGQVLTGTVPSGLQLPTRQLLPWLTVHLAALTIRLLPNSATHTNTHIPYEGVYHVENYAINYFMELCDGSRR